MCGGLYTIDAIPIEEKLRNRIKKLLAYITELRSELEALKKESS